jgi:hypothetical protein
LVNVSAFRAKQILEASASPAILSSIGYGYFYAREKKGDKIQFEDFTTPERVDKFVGNIIKGELSDEKWNNELPIAIRELFTEVVKLGGTLSGEHGIGLVQQSYMDIAFPEVTLNIMREIKRVFDPKNILNPGKVFN